MLIRTLFEDCRQRKQIYEATLKFERAVFLGMMQKVLVLGSNGRLGNALKHVIRMSPQTSLRFEFASRTEVNLSNFSETLRFFEAMTPNIVVNFAAQVSSRIDSYLDQRTLHDEGLQIIQNIHRACLLSGVSQMLQASSYHIFSREVEVPFRLGFVPSPGELNFETPYSATKATEFLYAAQANDMPSAAPFRIVLFVMPNIFGPYGPEDLDREHFVGASVRRIQSAMTSQIESLQVFGPRSQIREYLYSLDAAEQILKIVLDPEKHHFFSVISSGQQLSQEQCWLEIVKATGYQGESVFSEGQANGRDMFFADRSFVPTHFGEALRSTVSWYKSKTQTG